MDISFGIFFFILGIVVGSFLNVVVLRYRSGLKATQGRSICFTCGKTLHWYELIPVVSFFIQGARCRGCKSRISWQYPLVELLTGVIFTLVYFKEGLTIILPLQLILWCVLIAILVYDMKHMIIPDAMVIIFTILAFMILALEASTIGGGVEMVDVFAGVFLFIPFYALWFFSYGKWIGLGDGKLAIGIGTLLGISGGVSAVMLAFWIGAIVSVFLLILDRVLKHGPVRRILSRFFPRGLNIKSEIPFAPFLIAGTFLAYFYSITFTTLSVSLFSLHL
ncbi:MAG: prepilin peptidase [Candidatus Paceibacterota bacterium]|jgi:prepilin signal peptidase PulO-like enzyme (type II secretory pathway)